MKFPVVFTPANKGTVWYGVACCQKLGQMLDMDLTTAWVYHLAGVKRCMAVSFKVIALRY